jgi:hypothetical protein
MDDIIYDHNTQQNLPKNRTCQTTQFYTNKGLEEHSDSIFNTEDEGSVFLRLVFACKTMTQEPIQNGSLAHVILCRMISRYLM